MCEASRGVVGLDDLAETAPEAGTASAGRLGRCLVRPARNSRSEQGFDTITHLGCGAGAVEEHTCDGRTVDRQLDLGGRDAGYRFELIVELFGCHIHPCAHPA